MLGILIDGAILMVLLKTIDDEEIGFGTSLLVAFATSIGTSLLALALAAAMGVVGIGIAALIAAALLGVALSALFGMEIKRALLVAGAFMVAHIGISIVFSMLLHR
jgi:hypothetical protein